MSAVEQQARSLWRGWAEFRGHGRCDGCGQMRYVGRGRRSKRRLCVECFEHESEGRRHMKRLRR